MTDEYFAELDERNRVACVWVRARDGRIPRPLGFRGTTATPSPSARFHGAPRDAILDWIARESRRSAGLPRR